MPYSPSLLWRHAPSLCSPWVAPPVVRQPGAFATPADPRVTALARGAPLWYKRLSMRSIGFPELLIIFGIAVLFFGSNKIPDLAKGLGEGIRNFKAAIKGDEPPKA